MENHHKQLQNYKVPLGLILGETMTHSLLSNPSEKKTMFLGGGNKESFTHVIDNNLFNQLFNKVSTTIHNKKPKRNTTRKSEPRLSEPRFR